MGRDLTNKPHGTVRIPTAAVIVPVMTSTGVAGDAFRGAGDDRVEEPRGAGLIAGCFIGGIVLGLRARRFLVVVERGRRWRWGWRAWMMQCRDGSGVVRVALLAGLTAFGAAWVGARAGEVEPGELSSRYVWPEGALAQVEGVVVDEPQIVTAKRGYFEGYGYEPPPTLLELRVDRLVRDAGAGGPTGADGTLVVKVEEAAPGAASGPAVEGPRMVIDADAAEQPG